MLWYRIILASWDPTHVDIDYDIQAQEAYIQPSEEGFSVFNLADNSYLLTFHDASAAQEFAKEYNAANLRRKNVGKVWEKYLSRSIDSEAHVAPESKILRLDPEEKHDKEQKEQRARDLVLAPQTWAERRERYLKLKREGLPYVPEMEKELDEFRTNPSRPHGRELPPPSNVPDLPSVEEIRGIPSPWRRQLAPSAQVQRWQRVAYTGDMNYLISPEGREVPAPGISHSGEAQKIVQQTEGRTMDPSLALDYLVTKKKWIRVSGEMFELFNFKFRKPQVISFIGNHQDYYRQVRNVEIDDRSKGNSYQLPLSSIYQLEEVGSEAVNRADEMMKWRN